MNVRRKITLIVTASILLTAVPGAWLIYRYAHQQIIQAESAAIAKKTSNLIAPATQRFVEAGVKLPALSRLLQAELSKPADPTGLSEFHRQMVRGKDGVWRNRKPPYDGKREAGIFLPPNANESDTQKLQHWRIKHVLDSFGAAASRKLENTWFLSPERSEIIFDASMPDFTIGMPADNDYTHTPWLSYTSPQLNPLRLLRYTPPLYDPVAKAWMVSAVFPLYLGDKWLGTIGEDMQLSNVMESLFASTQLYDETQHFLVDSEGHFVLVGAWQKQLEAAQDSFVPDFSAEPELQQLLKSTLTDKPQVLAQGLMLNGRAHIAVGVQIQPLGWRYFQLVPVEQVMATTNALFKALAGMIVLISLLSGYFIEIAVSRSIINRLQRLSEAMRQYGKGEYKADAELMAGEDEIAYAARAFSEMTGDIDRSNHDRILAENALRASEERWHFALEGAGDGVWDWSVQTGEAIFSKRWKEMIGYDEHEFPNLSDAWLAHLHPDDREQVLAQVEAYFAGELSIYTVEFRMRCKNGSYKWILARGMLVSRDAEGKPLRMIGTHADISVRKQTEEDLRLAALVYQVSSEAMLITDANNRIIAVNPAFTSTTGYTEDEIIGQSPNVLSSGRQDPTFYQTMWDALNTSGRWQGEIWDRRKNGEVYAEHLTINTIYDTEGLVHRRVAMFSDITEKLKSEEIIWHQANFDLLTGLPNRRMFRDRLAQEIKKADRATDAFALLFIDLDRFKEVNDSLGHHVGDDLLVQASQRLIGCVRESDTVARLGGDEFTVILSHLHEMEDIDQLTQTIINRLAEPYFLGSEVAHISASIGITVYPDDATQLEQLLQNADQAMYVSKEEGRNRYSYFTPALQEAAKLRLRLIGELSQALTGNQLRVYFQPIIELATGNIFKAEALLRWQHPLRGLVSPMTFIPLAEETGLINPIGEWVFHESARHAKRWSEMAGNRSFQISVNKSPIQFRSKEDTPESWIRFLRDNGLSGRSIAIEITEGLLLNKDDETVRKLLQFRDAGIQVSIDDFGTGYSALSYLKKFDIDYLKIDQSFVRNMASDPADMALCEAIVVMAHKLGLKVIAEGVETREQRDLLMQIGCDLGQGYLFAKPMPAEEFDALLKAR
ncbi:EAL domain-containing protein [Ferriphaselus sp. R-1]|uniref:EAL domain-containing protein n=1 Tax=Ferriphaselus sp. R-1 TaxID=1485544 RepID=UPI00068E78A4|nr:EAL domain-containing protein [Ferriphaselus sp. R-1]